MSQQEIAASYADAIMIVRNAKLSYIDFASLNDKAWRVIEYLEKQAKAELTCLTA